MAAKQKRTAGVKASEDRKGKTAARGYGNAWKQKAAKRVAGAKKCARCAATSNLTLDHDTNKVL